MSIRPHLRRPLEVADARGEPTALYISVGQLIVSWSFVEAAVDFTVAVVFQKFGGNSIEKKIPRSLKRKIDFIKRSLRFPELQYFAAEGMEIMKKISKLSTTRHLASHGMFQNLPGDLKSSPIQIHKVSYEQTAHKMKVETVTLAELDRTAQEIRSIGVVLADWLQDVLEATLPGRT